MSDDAFDEVLRHAEARIGSTLKGKWTLDQLLGVGGMAAVYAATHRNHKRVAIKVLHQELSFNAAVRQRFQREGYVANMVQHPGAVSVDDDDLGEDGCAFLVMELLDGETLDARWARKDRRLPPGEVLALMDRVLDTLAAAHAHGIVHRDLKPENLFFTRDAQVKVLDFGIARVRELSGGSKTQTGSLMGTPSFMPPEQARGRWDEVDAQSDLWAVGATMFTLLSGELVHVAGTVNEALVLAVTQPARSLGAVRPDLPQALIAFVDKALAYDKQARWPDALAMQTALREAYAALQSDWDEDTVLDDAAASLPEKPAGGHASAVGNVTELVTAKSNHPLATVAQHRLPLIAGGALLGAALLASLAISTCGGGPRAVLPEVASPAAAVAPVAPANSALSAAPAITPPVQPPLALEDLPPDVEAKRPAPAAAATHSLAPLPLSTKPTASAASKAAKPTSKTADPFAARE
jgi:serine/threonine-protein kinase